MPEKKKITGIILAGGKSSRMKTEKGLVSLQGKPLVEHVIGQLEKITGSILLISADPAYQSFGYPCFGDVYKDKGPLAGIFTGLTHSPDRKNIVLGCDMPFLTEKILTELVTESGEEDVLITEHNGMAEPLFAVYDRSCIPHFRALLEAGRLKITDALAGLKVRVINFDGRDWFAGNEFTNINTAEELRKYEHKKN